MQMGLQDKKEWNLPHLLGGIGYCQIPGVDFLDNYLPVVHDVTFRILILVLISIGLKAKIVDVETAFLYGNIEKKYSWSVHQEWQMLKRMISLH